MKKIIFTFLLVLSSICMNAQDVGKYAEVYKGNRGLNVTVVRYGAFDKNQALVQISGFDHPWDGKIFLCTWTFSRTSMNIDYSTKIDGVDYMLMRLNGNEIKIELKDGWAFTCKYSEEASRAESPVNLFNIYNTQSKEQNTRFKSDK